MALGPKARLGNTVVAVTRFERTSHHISHVSLNNPYLMSVSVLIVWVLSTQWVLNKSLVDWPTDGYDVDPCSKCWFLEEKEPFIFIIDISPHWFCHGHRSFRSFVHRLSEPLFRGWWGGIDHVVWPADAWGGPWPLGSGWGELSKEMGRH